MNWHRDTCYRITTSLWNSPLRLPGADRGDSVSIVCFHGVHDEAMECIAPPPTSSVSAASFEDNVRALSRYYRIISLAEAVAMLTGRTAWRPKCAVLTFDDSLKCTTDVAFPILRRLGATATIFVSTAAIEGARPYWWLRLDYAFHRGTAGPWDFTLARGQTIRVDRGDIESFRRLKAAVRSSPPGGVQTVVDAICGQFGASLEDAASQFPYAQHLSWQDARDAIAHGFAVGSHTVSHPNLTLLEPAEVRAELADSKKKIEHELGTPCRHFCYPYGYFLPATATQAAACGYDAAVTTVGPGRNGAGCDVFQLNRFAAPATAPKLAFNMSGFRNAFGKT